MSSDSTSEAGYSIEVFAGMAGVETATVLHYQEQGLLLPAPAGGTYDTEALRRLRRIEHLRTTCAVNDTGLKLILSLLEEVERLRDERRRPR